jgi:hypothetical protein
MAQNPNQPNWPQLGMMDEQCGSTPSSIQSLVSNLQHPMQVASAPHTSSPNTSDGNGACIGKF